MVIEKNDNESGSFIFGVCKDFVRKLTDYFFANIDEEIEFKNPNIIYYHFKNAKLTRRFGPMCINFYEYPPYTVAISGCF